MEPNKQLDPWDVLVAADTKKILPTYTYIKHRFVDQKYSFMKLYASGVKATQNCLQLASLVCQKLAFVQQEEGQVIKGEFGSQGFMIRLYSTLQPDIQTKPKKPQAKSSYK